MLRIPLYVDNRLTDDDDVTSLMHLPRFTPDKHFYFCICYLFLLEAECTSVAISCRVSRFVNMQKLADISEEDTASVFRV
jgi:hypothetical protein